MFKNSKTSLIFCAGGVGSRMGNPIPKQYLPLAGKPIALHSFDLFVESPWIDEIVVVCEEAYRSYFESAHKPLLFAAPGKLRQDSVYSGLLQTSPQSEFILSHDSARPFLETKYLEDVLEAVKRTGAAALASPIACTIKECNEQRIVQKTLDRSRLWEMQTPQAMRRSLYFEVFEFVKKNKIEATDDMALAEQFGHPVEIVHSTPRNLKITTPFDLAVAQTLLNLPCATN